MSERISGSLDQGRVTFRERHAQEALRDEDMEDGELTCDDVMSPDVQFVSEEDTIKDAARKMRLCNIGFLPVCDADRRVLGTITDRDITIRAVADNRPPDACRVGEVMTRDVVACRPEDPLATCERYMAHYQKSRVVVTGDDGRLCGVISLSDIAEIEAPEAAHTLCAVAAREAGDPLSR
jgi:CBS domain-containing protein